MILWSDEILIRLSQTKLFSRIPREQLEDILNDFKFYCFSFSTADSFSAVDTFDIKNFLRQGQKAELNFQVLEEKVKVEAKEQIESLVLYLLESDAYVLFEPFEENLSFLQKKEEMFIFHREERLFLTEVSAKVLFFDVNKLYAKILERPKTKAHAQFVASVVEHLFGRLSLVPKEQALKKKEKAKTRLWTYLLAHATKEGEGQFTLGRVALAEELSMSRQHLEKLLKQLKMENKLSYTHKTYVIKGGEG